MHTDAAMRVLARRLVSWPRRLALTSSIVLAVAASQAALTQPAPVLAPDATVSVSARLIAVGVGYGWGRGMLDYQGEKLNFCMRGMEVGDLGAASIKAQGVVFYLKSLEDFPGRYVAIATGAALIKGQSTAMLKNEHGVIMQLQAKESGVRMAMAASGVRISLAGQRGCAAAASSPHG